MSDNCLQWKSRWWLLWYNIHAFLPMCYRDIPSHPTTPFLSAKALRYLQHRDLLWHHAWLTNHWGLNEAPGVGLGDVGLQDARGSAGLVHPSKDIDLAPTDGGGGRVHGLGQGRDGLPLVGDGVVPEDDSSSSELGWAALGTTHRHGKAAWQAEGKQRWKCGFLLFFFLNVLQIQPLGKWCNECFSLRF